MTVPGRPSDGLQENVKTIYVGNLSFNANRHDLTNLFKPYGAVHSSRIMIDRATRKSRGFGFVEMSATNADAAIAALDGIDFSGRNIRVNEATQQTPHHRR
ncbi:MAG: RNA-binding protein [Gammaproteobacteria bacterium]|nr:RNA-binding protein [Gammaproteobacteria bacterium]MDH5801170.1 RNA-binding protein [Gammaproteobacteria bacterium]